MNFFNYESRPMQILMLLGDLIILNLLYLLCCLPVFTIGAAQAGLYTGLKTLLDPEDDTYCSSAFFKGFKTGFGKITIAWNLLFVLEIILAVVALFCVFYTASTNSIQVWCALIALALVCLFQSLLPLFHARFNCSPWQLIRNAWFLALAHPIRSLFVAAVTWLPLILALYNFSLFMPMTPIFLMIYFSGAYLFCFSFMKKPFNTLIDHYNETHGIAPAPVAEDGETIGEIKTESESEE